MKLRKLAALPFVIILTGIATMILMLAEYQRLKTQRRLISCLNHAHHSKKRFKNSDCLKETQEECPIIKKEKHWNPPILSPTTWIYYVTPRGKIKAENSKIAP